jgi:hypothetical protein
MYEPTGEFGANVSVNVLWASTTSPTAMGVVLGVSKKGSGAKNGPTCTGGIPSPVKSTALPGAMLGLNVPIARYVNDDAGGLHIQLW